MGQWNMPLSHLASTVTMVVIRKEIWEPVEFRNHHTLVTDCTLVRYQPSRMPFFSLERLTANLYTVSWGTLQNACHIGTSVMMTWVAHFHPGASLWRIESNRTNAV